MSLLDMLVVKGYIGTKGDKEGQETANGTVLLERGQKKATWRKAWAVHVNFSNVIPEVCGSLPAPRITLTEWSIFRFKTKQP